MNYYVSVSSFDKKQEANILIRVPGDEKEIKGSLRFNYMIPVPEECIERLIIKDIEDDKYRILLNKEYQFCIENAERIQKKANKIYEMVTTNRKQILTDNSCAFRILEQGYCEYVEKVYDLFCNETGYQTPKIDTRAAIFVDKLFVQCEYESGTFEDNIETTEISFFDRNSLPENLAVEKCTKEQILMCFESFDKPDCPTIFD